MDHTDKLRIAVAVVNRRGVEATVTGVRRVAQVYGAELVLVADEGPGPSQQAGYSRIWCWIRMLVPPTVRSTMHSPVALA